ncbi:hypothetical protein [Staphylococcus epidermidis]|uniref:hypothetical protein n=1 Tax=Staphylococcus epidermidis TaxID=1282 RepID=UPI0011A68829|nr:hypothetical protein [Staphylococcus epidermidis]
MRDEIKGWNREEIKVNIERDDNVREFIKEKMDEKFDEKIGNVGRKERMEELKWCLMRIEDKEEIVDENIESVEKWGS